MAAACFLGTGGWSAFGQSYPTQQNNNIAHGDAFFQEQNSATYQTTWAGGMQVPMVVSGEELGGTVGSIFQTKLACKQVVGATGLAADGTPIPAPLLLVGDGTALGLPSVTIQCNNGSVAQGGFQLTNCNGITANTSGLVEIAGVGYNSNDAVTITGVGSLIDNTKGDGIRLIGTSTDQTPEAALNSHGVRMTGAHSRGIGTYISGSCGLAAGSSFAGLHLEGIGQLVAGQASASNQGIQLSFAAPPGVPDYTGQCAFAMTDRTFQFDCNELALASAGKGAPGYTFNNKFGDTGSETDAYQNTVAIGPAGFVVSCVQNDVSITCSGPGGVTGGGVAIFGGAAQTFLQARNDGNNKFVAGLAQNAPTNTQMALTTRVYTPPQTGAVTFQGTTVATTVSTWLPIQIGATAYLIPVVPAAAFT